MSASPTGFICPTCKNTEQFYADRVMLFGNDHHGATHFQASMEITPDGWDWSLYHNNADIPDDTQLECALCHFADNVSAFIAPH